MTLATAAAIILADIFMMGDSTMCDYKPGSYPQEGWGQRLRTFVKDGVKVHNRAVGGISSKTFIDSGRWQKVLDDIKPGDYAIMAFGHNDATKSKPQRYCNREDYTKNMSLFVDGIRGKGATPVLATSIIHIGGVKENADGKVSVRADAAALGPYLAATRELAQAKDVPLLDLNAAAKAAFEKMAKKEIESHYMVLGPAESWYALKGKTDRCHPRDKGADFYARTAVELAKANAPKLYADCFKDPATVPFVPTPKPKGIDKAYRKLLADEAEKLAKGVSDRRRFDEKTGEHQGKTLADYAEVVKSVAAARGVPVVDLNDASYRMQGKMGAKGSAKLQCNNKGKIDNTHHNVYGAYEMARIVAAGLAEIPTVKDAIREPYRSFNPESPDADPKIPPSGKTDFTKPEGS